MNRRIILLLTIGVAMGALVSGCQPLEVISITPRTDRRPKAVEIIEQHHGNDSGFKEPIVLLINSYEELEALNSLHLVNQTIDFDSRSAVVLALGEKPTGGYWARITAIQRKGDQLYVQGTANRPHRDQTVPQLLTYPYAAAVVKKIHSAQVLSEIDSVLGRQPVDKPSYIK